MVVILFIPQLLTQRSSKIMTDRNEIVRQRQSAIRRELDRRGIALKVVSLDSQIPYSSLQTYLPLEGGDKPVMMPMAVVYALAESRAVPDDLLSLLLPAGCMIVRAPDGIDHDELEKAARDYLAAKGEVHHPDSPAARDISDCETVKLDSKAAVLVALAA